MPTDYLGRGVLAGAVVGVAYGLYMALVAHPLVEHAEGLITDHGADAAHAVSETTTAAVSVGSGVLWGVLLGGLFGLAYYLLEPALPGRGTAKAFVLAGAGYFTVSVAPWLVLPPTVPGAAPTLGIQERVVIYAGMMVVGALVAAAALVGYRLTAPRSRRLAAVVAATPVVALIAVVPLASPTIVDHGTAPAEFVAAFQGLTVLSQAAVWIAIAATFAWLQGRAEAVDDAEFPITARA